MPLPWIPSGLWRLPIRVSIAPLVVPTIEIFSLTPPHIVLCLLVPCLVFPCRRLNPICPHHRSAPIWRKNRIMLEFICVWIIFVVIIVGMYILSFQLDNPFSRIADECFDDFSHKFYVFCKRQKWDYILAISFICFAYMLLSAFKIPWLSCLNHRYPYGGCPLGSSAPLIVPTIELFPLMPHFTSYVVVCPSCPISITAFVTQAHRITLGLKWSFSHRSFQVSSRRRCKHYVETRKEPRC